MSFPLLRAEKKVQKIAEEEKDRVAFGNWLWKDLSQVMINTRESLLTKEQKQQWILEIRKNGFGVCPNKVNYWPTRATWSGWRILDPSTNIHSALLTAADTCTHWVPIFVSTVLAQVDTIAIV